MDAILTLQQKRLLRVDEAARILNVSRWVEDGRLGGTRLGAGSLRIFSNTVATLIDQHCVGGTDAAVVTSGAQPLTDMPASIARQDLRRGGIRPRQQAR